MSLNLLSYDHVTRCGMIHDTEHDLDRDYFYAFDAGESDSGNALDQSVAMMLIPPFGYSASLAPLVANAYRNQVATEPDFSECDDSGAEDHQVEDDEPDNDRNLGLLPAWPFRRIGY